MTLTTIALPEFFIAYMLMFFFAIKFRWFYSLSTVSESTTFLEHISRAALPALTLTLVIIAHMMRMTRAAIINLLASPYIEMAQLKGVPRGAGHPPARAAQCLGADRHRHRLQSRLSRRRRRRGRSGLRLSGHRPD